VVVLMSMMPVVLVVLVVLVAGRDDTPRFRRSHLRATADQYPCAAILVVRPRGHITSTG